MRRRDGRNRLAVRSMDRAIADGGPRGALVTLPGEVAPIHHVEVPERLRGSVRRRVAEQQLSALLHLPVEGLDLRVGPTGPSGRAPVLVVDQTKLAAWRADLTRSDITPRGLCPDYLALPITQNGWTIATDPTPAQHQRVLVRLGPTDGFAVPAGLARWSLNAALDRLGKPRRLSVIGALENDVQAWITSAGLDEATVPIADEDATPTATDLDAIRTLDLLHDDVASAQAIVATLRAWRAPAAGVVMGLAALIAAIVIDIRQLEAERETLDTMARQIARDVFLGQAPILSIRQQVARVISDRTGGTDGPAPLENLRLALGALDRSVIEMRAITQDATGTVLIELSTDGFGSLEAAQRAIAEAGPDVDMVRSSAQPEGGVLAVLAVSTGSAAPEGTR